MPTTTGCLAKKCMQPGVRGTYYRRLLTEGANVVVLEPDVAKAFRSSAAVNEWPGGKRPPLNAPVRPQVRAQRCSTAVS